MNSFLLICDVFSFFFWKKLKTPKRHFEIIWPLAQNINSVWQTEIGNWDDKQQSQARSDWCKMEMAFWLARWRCKFLGTAWSIKSDANLPGIDTKPPRGNNPLSLLFSSSISRALLSKKYITQLHNTSFSNSQSGQMILK